MKTISVWIKSELRYEQIFIDDEDFDRVKERTWHCNNISNRAYVIATKIQDRTISLANFILKAEKRKIIDHKDRNPFNCQKENLRYCTQQQNVWNQGPRLGYEYKGVSYHKLAKKYSAQINKDYKKIHLGLFDTPEKAAKAYDRAALKYHGEFAYQNFGNGAK